MPVYVYEIVKPDGSAGPRFEVEHSMQEPALTVHPATGEPIRRIYEPPNLTTRYTDGALRKKLDDKNIERAGFTKYVRDKVTGNYHKTAGKDAAAPETFRPS